MAVKKGANKASRTRSRKTSPKKTTKRRTSGPTKRAVKKRSSGRAKPKAVTFERWLSEVRGLHASGISAEKALMGAPVGACLLKNPNGGGKYCIQTTAAACKAIGGTYRGGACAG